MKSKKFYIIVICTLLALTLTACNEDQYGAIVSYSDNGNTKTVTGTIDSISNNIATIKVDENTTNVDLYIVKVEDITDDGGNKIEVVDKFGIIENLDAEGKDEINVSLEDITWIKAEWKVQEKYRQQFNQDKTFTINKDQEKFELPILVRNPFPKAKNYDDRIIKLNGRCGFGEGPEGWTQFNIVAENTHIGISHTYAYNFYPYLDGEKFGLDSDVRYAIMPKKQFFVNWE